MNRFCVESHHEDHNIENSAQQFTTQGYGESLGLPRMQDDPSERDASHGVAAQSQLSWMHEIKKDENDNLRHVPGRCKFVGCDKFSRGQTRLCIGHGGGVRCRETGCSKAARGSSGFCIGHGGGRRCTIPDCTKSAIGGSEVCIAHGGGKRCIHNNCPKVAQGNQGLCFAHGGGRRCKYEGCSKSMQGRTKYCRSHNSANSSGDTRPSFENSSTGASSSKVEAERLEDPRYLTMYSRESKIKMISDNCIESVGPDANDNLSRDAQTGFRNFIGTSQLRAPTDVSTRRIDFAGAPSSSAELVGSIPVVETDLTFPLNVQGLARVGGPLWVASQQETVKLNGFCEGTKTTDRSEVALQWTFHELGS